MDTRSNEAIEPSVWTESFHVRSYEVDSAGNLAIMYLCNYLQEVAGNHARALGVSIEHLNASQMTWMLSRLHVQIDRFPRWRETVVIDTWPSGHNGLHATREFLIYTEDGEEVGKGTSGWLMIDLNRHRPVRMPAFVNALTLPELPRPIDDAFNKLPSPNTNEDKAFFSVGYHDLDVNQHANSMRYINWALEAIPYDQRANRTLKSLEVQFRAEAKYGDGIASRIDMEEDTVRHGLYARADGRVLALLRSTWRS